MNRKLAAATTAVLLAAAALTGCASTAQPLPQAPAGSAAAAEPAAEQEPAAVATTCDIVKEALLTGTPTQVTKAMRALKADRAMDATAREYAGYYIGRDKGSKDMQTADESLIQMSCA